MCDIPVKLIISQRIACMTVLKVMKCAMPQCWWQQVILHVGVNSVWFSLWSISRRTLPNATSLLNPQWNLPSCVSSESVTSTPNVTVDKKNSKKTMTGLIVIFAKNHSLQLQKFHSLVESLPGSRELLRLGRSVIRVGRTADLRSSDKIIRGLSLPATFRLLSYSPCRWTLSDLS